MPQTAPDTARKEPSPKLFKKVGLNPEFMYNFIVTMESAVTKNVLVQIDSFRKEVLARFSLQDERAASLATVVTHKFETLNYKFDQGSKAQDDKFKAQDDKFKALNDKFDDKFDTLIKEIAETNARIDRRDKRFWMLFLVVVGALLSGVVTIIVQALP